MAKKAKPKSVKVGKSRARPVRVAEMRIAPTYLPEGQTYTMRLHDVVRVIKVIEKHGHLAKFIRGAKKQKTAGTFDANTVNFVKDFMVKQKMHTDPIGKHIVNAAAAATARTGRFNCNF
jgi:hypothetical protein